MVAVVGAMLTGSDRAQAARRLHSQCQTGLGTSTRNRRQPAARFWSLGWLEIEASKEAGGSTAHRTQAWRPTCTPRQSLV